ncbi:MFS transporter [Mycobacteroides franklinii]|uniref:MFS transporter n=1 Tax=Mycobacteroides franklinii TaxID=948102 RepID=UPI0013E8F250|nr:MFS transporter [Mycobacteroides franklinii]
MPIAILALAVGAFGIGLTEFAIVGLLPEVATDLGVTEAAAGWLVSGYALTVALGAVLITLAVARWNRKHVLQVLFTLFILGNAVCALAPTYPVMLVGRIIAALCHGAFFGIGTALAVRLVAEDRQSRAVALILTGLTTSNVIGVPFGTWLGQQFGWRAAFWAIVIVGVLALAAIAVWIPLARSSAPVGVHLTDELSAFTLRRLWLALAVTLLTFASIFAAFTYIAFTLVSIGKFSASAIPWILVAFGLGQFGGTLLGGREADRSLTRALLITLIGLACAQTILAVSAGNQILSVAALILLGAFGFGSVPALQTRVITLAGSAPTLASSANISAINLGIAFGAVAGGEAIAAGLGYRSPIWIGALLAVVAVIVVAASQGRPAASPPH